MFETDVELYGVQRMRISSKGPSWRDIMGFLDGVVGVGRTYWRGNDGLEGDQDGQQEAERKHNERKAIKARCNTMNHE